MKYVAVLRTWPQVKQYQYDLEIRTKELSSDDTVQDIVDWMLDIGEYLKNVTITITD